MGEFGDDEAPIVFKDLCGEGNDTISKEAFTKFIAMYMFAIKESAMTTHLRIKEGGAVKRVAQNSVVMVLEGPVMEGTVNISRVKARCMKDGVEGWITVAGNQGTTFLKEGGNR